MEKRLQCPEMIIMMGLQGSGKTTLCTQKLIAEGFVHISMDVLKNRRREETVLQNCLNESRSCVIDNTNPTRAEREKDMLPKGNRTDSVLSATSCRAKAIQCILTS